MFFLLIFSDNRLTESEPQVERIFQALKPTKYSIFVIIRETDKFRFNYSLSWMVESRHH